MYVSFTWNMENRFGGGALTTVGLKDDGKRLLEVLATNRIAVDLSHASDRLAYDIFNYIDKHKLDMKVIASHSVMRAIHHAPRNLPDEIAKEIIKRKGIIGLNFIAKFIGPDMKAFPNTSTGCLCLGAVIASVSELTSSTKMTCPRPIALLKSTFSTIMAMQALIQSFWR